MGFAHADGAIARTFAAFFFIFEKVKRGRERVCNSTISIVFVSPSLYGFKSIMGIFLFKVKNLVSPTMDDVMYNRNFIRSLHPKLTGNFVDGGGNIGSLVRKGGANGFTFSPSGIVVDPSDFVAPKK